MPSGHFTLPYTPIYSPGFHGNRLVEFEHWLWDGLNGEGVCAGHQ